MRKRARHPVPRRSIGFGTAAVLTVAVLGSLYLLYGPGRSPGKAPGDAARTPTSPEGAALDRTVEATSSVPSPFELVDERVEAAPSDESPSVEAAAADGGSIDGGSTDVGSDLARSTPDPDRAVPGVFDTPFDVARVGEAGWTDADFYRDAARLRADPDALALLIESFRAETDPARLTKLASLLGEVGHPGLVALGADMASSGNAASRDAGLSLLQHIQPDDEGARQVLVGLLASENDPAVLKSIIDAVSVPGDAAPEDTGALVAQLVPLTRHESAAVRRNGVTVLSRWAADENVTPVLQAALDDPDRGVRSSAVYAFADYPLVDESVREDLLVVLENRDEEAGIRSGALLALQRTELDGEQARRLDTVRREMNRRRPADPP